MYSALTSGYHRVYIQVGGYNRFWTTFTPTQVAANIAQALDSAGIGYESIKNNHAIAFNPSYFEFTITVIALDGQSDNFIKQFVANALNNVLSEVITTVLPNANSNDWSINSVLGDNAATNATIFGLSTGTVILVGLGLVFLLARNSPTGRAVTYLRGR